ncbi:MAG TPA: class I SAM-dependent methyltransferase [Polyangiaceae bacterium]|jgi:2-polyprenyl-3-methyl-5-hydroxy-6-metoxy-1,4-benzoquinol methylase
MWASSVLPDRLEPRRRGPRNFVIREFDRYLRKVLAGQKLAPGWNLLEIGAGNSAWLSYFATEHGASVTGLDYSSAGCQKLQRILKRDGVDGKVIHADAFAPPPGAVGSFDVVVSFGVAEHFQDTRGALSAFKTFVKPGGLLLTFVPNMAGVLGKTQRLLNKPVYDIHVPLDATALASAHERAGLTVEACDYLVFLNFGVLNLNGLPPNTATFAAKRALLALARRAAFVCAAVEERTHALPLTRTAASYVVAVARRSTEAPHDSVVMAGRPPKT